MHLFSGKWHVSDLPSFQLIAAIKEGNRWKNNSSYRDLDIKNFYHRYKHIGAFRVRLPTIGVTVLLETLKSIKTNQLSSLLFIDTILENEDLIFSTNKKWVLYMDTTVSWKQRKLRILYIRGKRLILPGKFHLKS